MLCHKWKPPREIIDVDVNYEVSHTKVDELVDVNIVPLNKHQIQNCWYVFFIVGEKISSYGHLSKFSKNNKCKIYTV